MLRPALSLRLVRPPRFLREFLPALILAVSIAGLIAYCSGPRGGYHPLKVAQLKVEPQVLMLGEDATFLNGICNRTDKPVAGMVILTAQREGVDPLLASSSIRLIPTATATTAAALFTFKPGCTGTDPITMPLPPILPAGRWHLNLQITVLGETESQLQRINIVSNSFEVSTNAQ